MAWDVAFSLNTFFTPVPGEYAPTLRVALYRLGYRFDERTSMNILHTWWLARLLFVFVLACPFLIVPVLLGFFKKHSDAKNRAEAPTEQGARVEVSGRGTWNAQADSRSQSLQPDGALSPIERRAA
jgi:urea transporter